MSWLRIYSEVAKSGDAPLLDSHDVGVIAKALDSIGVLFERWPTVTLPADVSESEVLQAHAAEIQRLKRNEGYQSVDVVRMTPDHPERVALREKFLSEHTHGEDEVRFFVDGSGLFSMHANAQVFVLLCERGDLIRVPAGLRHWFDMGEAPFFTAVRLFTNPAGWVADFTGNPIADRFPRFPIMTQV